MKPETHDIVELILKEKLDREDYFLLFPPDFFPPSQAQPHDLAEEAHRLEERVRRKVEKILSNLKKAGKIERVSALVERGKGGFKLYSTESTIWRIKKGSEAVEKGKAVNNSVPTSPAERLNIVRETLTTLFSIRITQSCIEKILKENVLDTRGAKMDYERT